MTLQALYCIGMPGAGKSTLMATVLAGMPGVPMRAGLVRYCQYAHGVELGASRALFSGTDALPMHVQPAVLAWVERCRPLTILGEGDRLANDAFFHALIAFGYTLTLAWLDCPPLLADLRRASRPSRPNASWLAGRATKVAGIVARWPEKVWRLDARLPVETLATQIRQHPALRQLVGDDTLDNSQDVSQHAAP